MSNIKLYKCDLQDKVLSSTYENTLKRKIAFVCKKINFNDSKIKWFIYRYNIFKHTCPPYINIENGNRFGYCDAANNTIWISILAINIDLYTAQQKKIDPTLILNPCPRDYLAEIIIDEITHIQTQLDHGNSKYDKKLKDNLNKYYSSYYKIFQ